MLTTGFNNTSAIPHLCTPEKPYGVEEPKASSTLRVVLMTVMLSMAFVGNAMVCRGATRMSNRPFSYNLIVNLAFAEILLSVTYPFLFHYVTDPWSWVFGKTMCKLVTPSILCSVSVITFTLAAIAVYRCLILVQPRKPRPSKRTAYLVILCSWIWGIALSMPSSITRDVYELPVCGPNILLRCRETFPNKNMEHNYTIVIFVLQFVVPFLVMVLSYSIVIAKVRKHIKKTKEEHETSHSLQLSSHSQQSTGESLTPSRRNRESQRNSTRILQLESDLLRMIYIIILVFFLCYLPSHIVFISKQFNWFSLEEWKYNFILNRYTDLLNALPSTLHPICYGSMSKLIASACHRPQA